MIASSVLVNNVFVNNRILKIPYFQRGYVWNKDNWEQFFNDIATVASLPGDYKEPYFLGSIIIKQSNSVDGVITYDVIDGQQRLTTIVLFMKALYLSMDKNIMFNQSFMRLDFNGAYSPILHSNYNNRISYNNLVNQENLNFNRLDEDDRLDSAFSYFAQRIMNARDGHDEKFHVSPQELLNAMTTSVNLICIEVSKDENAQKIFETINCAGVKLTTGELLKNHLFDENNVNGYETLWRPVFEGDCSEYWDGEFVKGKNKDSRIEDFFYHYMLIKMQDPNVRPMLSSIDVKILRQKSGLFEHYRLLQRRCNFNSNDLIQEIVDFAKLYRQTFSQDILGIPIPKYQSLKRIVCLTYATKVWTPVPFILYVVKNVPDINEQVKIFGYLESYLLRRMICKSQNNNYSDMFSENLIGGQRIATANEFISYVNDRAARGALLMPSDEEVKEAINSKDLKGSAGVLLYMLESKINDQFEAAYNGCRGYENYYPAILMPEKNNDAWPMASGYTSEQRQTLVHTLGNFVMLDNKVSPAINKCDWAEKKSKMKDFATDLKNCQLLQGSLPNWDESTIERRNNWLAEQFIQYWPNKFHC